MSDMKLTGLQSRPPLYDYNSPVHEVVFDFSNDWHVALNFREGDDHRAVAHRLVEVAWMIMNCQHSQEVTDFQNFINQKGLNECR
jgi:hypothetical protein